MYLFRRSRTIVVHISRRSGTGHVLIPKLRDRSCTYSEGPGPVMYWFRRSGTSRVHIPKVRDRSEYWFHSSGTGPCTYCTAPGPVEYISHSSRTGPCTFIYLYFIILNWWKGKGAGRKLFSQLWDRSLFCHRLPCKTVDFHHRHFL